MHQRNLILSKLYLWISTSLTVLCTISLYNYTFYYISIRFFPFVYYVSRVTYRPDRPEVLSISLLLISCMKIYRIIHILLNPYSTFNFFIEKVLVFKQYLKILRYNNPFSDQCYIV